MQDDKSVLIFSLLGIITAVLYIIGSFFPSPATWGFHFLAFLPAWLKISIPLLMLVFMIPHAQSFMLANINLSVRILSDKPKSLKYFLVIVLITAAVLLLWNLRQKFFLLGDGSLIIRIIHDQISGSIDPSVFRNEPLSGYILIKTAKLFSGIIPAPAEESLIQAAIILISLPCCFLTWMLASRISKNPVERILLSGIVISSGALPLFFGYIETYIPVYCGILAYVYYSLRYLDGEASLILPAAVYGILFCLHFGILVFIPSLALLLYHNIRTSKGKDILAAVFIMLLVCVSILWYLKYPLQHLIALFEKSGKHTLISGDFSENSADYGLFSYYHLINIINFLIMMGVFCTGIIVFRSKHYLDNGNQFRIFFLCVLGLMGLFFVLFFRTEIGMSRDWDILAVFFSGFVIAGVSFLLNSEFEITKRYRLLLMAFGVTFLQSVSFVLVNSQETWARERFEILPDSKLWPKSGMLSAYEEYAIYHRGRQDPGNALKYFSLYWGIDSTNPRICISTAHIFDLMGDRINVVASLHKALKLSPDNWEIYSELGSAYGSLGMHEAAYKYLKKAQELNAGSPVICCALGVAALNLNHDYVEASKYFNITVALDPAYADAYAGLAYCAMHQNDPISARKFRDIYTKMKAPGKSSPEIQKMLDGIR